MNKLRDLVDPSFRIQKWKYRHHDHTAEDFLGVTGHFNPGLLNPNLEPQASALGFQPPDISTMKSSTMNFSTLCHWKVQSLKIHAWTS